MTSVSRLAIVAPVPRPCAGQPVEIPTPQPDDVPLPPAPHPPPPGPEPVPPEIEEPPLSPGTDEPVEDPGPPANPIRARGKRTPGFGTDVDRHFAADDDGLAQAQRLRAVGRLCSGISQEFNTLLQSLRHSLELIRRHADDVDQVQLHADRALMVAANGSRMTAQLIEFCGVQRASLRPTQLAGLLAARADWQQLVGPEIRIEMVGFHDAGWVLAVPDRLRAALANLIVNAGEAMRDGGAVVVRCERRRIENDAELPSGAYVQIAVEDQGPGIAPSLRDFVCEPFLTTKKVGDGPGLGLSQVYGFARHCGGAVRIAETAHGRGASVRLLLPATPGPGDGLRH
ncbi:ATP-binding protein [Piscinibacter sakaiensis]|uniref:ATP-binding protein n=1 Tax=Piscinibacter sakaiensis TaxID=1547922 RepID=UPI003AADD675